MNCIIYHEYIVQKRRYAMKFSNIKYKKLKIVLNTIHIVCHKVIKITFSHKKIKKVIT